jgi:SAM-dependent methyltransferase
METTIEKPIDVNGEQSGGQLARPHCSAFPPVLDACCGGRAFWFDKQDSRALFVDKRQGVFPIVRESPRSPVVVNPDWCGSFTAMPFPSDTFDHIIFDPPHIIESSASGNVAKTYGVLRGEWREELRGGFAECFRVLRPGGTLIFKWNELHIPVNEILALTPNKPLYGHRSGKASKTHWVAFIKPNACLSHGEGEKRS